MGNRDIKEVVSISAGILQIIPFSGTITSGRYLNFNRLMALKGRKYRQCRHPCFLWFKCMFTTQESTVIVPENGRCQWMAGRSVGGDCFVVPPRNDVSERPRNSSQ